MLDREKTRQALMSMLRNKNSTDDEVRILVQVASAFVEGRLIDRETITDAEKMVAVTLRREFPDPLPTTDDWRPISQRACQLVAQRLEFDLGENMKQEEEQ